MMRSKPNPEPGAPEVQMATSRSGRMRKVIKYGQSDQDAVPRGNLNRNPAETAQLQTLKDRFRDHKGYYPTGGQASSVKWLKARIAEMEGEKDGDGVVVMDERQDRLNKELEREQKVEQKRLDQEAKELQRKAAAEDQRKIRERKQREKEERMAEKLWSEVDDMALATAIGQIFHSRYGRQGAWPDVPISMGTNRSHDSCRHRWNVIKTQPAIEATVQLAAREHDETLRKRAKDGGHVLVEQRSPPGPERGTSPRTDDRAPSALRQSGSGACSRCKRLKRKCDGGLPCKACIEKGLGHECNYNPLAQSQRAGHGTSPVNTSGSEREGRESCRICKAAAGICRKWNAPGHLVDPLKPIPLVDGSSPNSVLASYESGGAQLVIPAQGTDWSADEDRKLREAVTKLGTSDWSRVAAIVGPRRAAQACRGRWRRLGAAGNKRPAAQPVTVQPTVRLAGGFRWQGLKSPRTGHEKEDYWKTYWAEAAQKQEQEQLEEAARRSKQQEEERLQTQKPEIHEELRECPGSKLPYTKSEFEEEFGGLVEWEAAKVVPNPIHTVYDAKLSPFTEALRKKAEVANKIAAKHAEAEKKRQLAATAEGGFEGYKVAMHISVPGKQSLGLEFGKYVCVEADGKNVSRVIVDGKVTNSPAGNCGLPLGLVLSHIEGHASDGDEIDKFMARKRQVADMPLFTLMQTLRITPRPMKLYFDGRVTIPKSSQHEVSLPGQHAVAREDSASSTPATSSTRAASTAATDATDAASDASVVTAGAEPSAPVSAEDASATAADGDSSGSDGAGESSTTVAFEESSAATAGVESSAPPVSGDASIIEATLSDVTDAVVAAAKSDAADTGRCGEHSEAPEPHTPQATMRAVFGKTVERLKDDTTKLTVTFTGQDDGAKFLTAEVRPTTTEELAEAGVENLSLRDVSRNWGVDEDTRLLLAVAKFGHSESDWDMVSAAIGGHRSGLSCKSRWGRVRAANPSQDGSGQNEADSDLARDASASVLTDRKMREFMGSGPETGVKQEDIGEDAPATQLAEGGAGQFMQPTFAAASAGLEEIRRMNDAKQKGKGLKGQEKEWVAKVRAEDLSGKQALLCKLLLAREPVVAVHCPQNSGVSYRCAFREGARTPLVELERACANVYGTSASGGVDLESSSKDRDSNKSEWRLSSTAVEDAIEAANGALGAGRQYTLVRQMNWWGCNACGQDVDQKYDSGSCCDVYKTLAGKGVPKSKRTTRRCRAVPHFVKNLEFVELSEDGEECVKPMVIPPVDPATGKTVGIETVSGGASVGAGPVATGAAAAATGTPAPAPAPAAAAITGSASVTVGTDASPPAPSWSPSREPSRQGVGKRRLSTAGSAGEAAGGDIPATAKRPRQ